MKKHMTIFTQIAILAFIFYDLSFAQNNKDSTQQQSLSEKHIDLKIALVKKKIKVGEKIELKISLKNNFTSTVDLISSKVDFLGGYQVEITDSKGEVIKQTEDPIPKITSRRSWEVNPKTEDKRILILSDVYELPAGKYLITVSREVNNTKKRESVFVKSNSVQIIIE